MKQGSLFSNGTELNLNFSKTVPVCAPQNNGHFNAIYIYI